jgi:xanthine dehydrogenase YagS FAD-binding subunit
VINIKTIPWLDYIKEKGGMLKIGAVTRLADVAAHPAVKQKYTALAQAAPRVATPHVRDMGTFGG